MDYQAAYEQLSKTLWAYDQAHGEAHTQLMREIRRIEENLYAAPPAQTAIKLLNQQKE